MTMKTCDWCGKIQIKGLKTHSPEFGEVEVCYDCLIEIYCTKFPKMRFHSETVMRDNLRNLHYGKPENIYLGYEKT